jgi:hypothetical protein
MVPNVLAVVEVLTPMVALELHVREPRLVRSVILKLQIRTYTIGGGMD